MHSALPPNTVLMEVQDGGPSQQLKGKVWQWRGIIERAFGCRRSGPAEGHGQADVEMEGYFSVEKFGVKTPRPTCVCMLRNDRGMHVFHCLYPWCKHTAAFLPPIPLPFPLKVFVWGKPSPLSPKGQRSSRAASASFPSCKEISLRNPQEIENSSSLVTKCQHRCSFCRVFGHRSSEAPNPKLTEVGGGIDHVGKAAAP